jgi:hypothetical protein
VAKYVIRKRLLAVVSLFLWYFKTFFVRPFFKLIERLVLSFVCCCVLHNDVRTRKSIGLATTVGMDIVLEFHLNVSRSRTRALSVYLCVCVQIISRAAK